MIVVKLLLPWVEKIWQQLLSYWITKTSDSITYHVWPEWEFSESFAFIPEWGWHLRQGQQVFQTVLTLVYLWNLIGPMPKVGPIGRSGMVQHSQRSPEETYTRKQEFFPLHLPAACTKYAKYKSSSLTETPMWWGWTQSPGLEHCGDFTRRSPSVLSRGIPLNKITMTRSNLHTLSAWRRQSILRILPFWSGLERTQHGGFFPVTVRTKSSRYSGRISFRNLARSREAHFCLTSGFSLSSSSFTALSSSFDMRFSCFLKYFRFRACRLNHV